MAGRFLQIDTQGYRQRGHLLSRAPGQDPLPLQSAERARRSCRSARAFTSSTARRRRNTPTRRTRSRCASSSTAEIDLLRAGLVAIDHSDTYVELTLQDETPAGTVRIGLVFDKDTKELVQWVLHSPDGSELTFSLFDVEKGVDIPAAYFYLNINDYNQIDYADLTALTSVRDLRASDGEAPCPTRVAMPFALATWNINSVRLRPAPECSISCAQHPVDVLCLQEIKCQNEQFPREAFAAAGYPHHAVHGQKGYHGVAIVSHKSADRYFEPRLLRDRGLPPRLGDASAGAATR